MIVLTWTLATLVVCSLVVIWLCHRAPLIEELEDEEDRLARIFLQAVHHREHLDAVFNEVCEIHGFVQDSFGYDTIADVIYAGHSYSEAMERIMRHEAWERNEG
jgi:hypothetical protein